MLKYSNILKKIYRVDILRRTLRRKVQTGIFYQQIYRLCHYILHQVAYIDYSAPSGKLHEPLTGVWEIRYADPRMVEGTVHTLTCNLSLHHHC